jgi:hypothetical protein
MKDHISVDKIINKNEFKILGDNTICSICQEVFYEPVQCQSCQNCFCKECILSWMKKSKACPFKCEKPEYKENRFVNNILSILKFKCDNGCDKEIQYSEITKHYEEDCVKINFKEKYFEILNLMAPFSHIHPLNVILYKSSNYKCDLCIRVLKSQFGLGCRNCNFDICKKCINKINKKNLHQHSLELVIDNFKCIICEKQYKSRKSFSCSKCKNCFICFDCAINKK